MSEKDDIQMKPYSESEMFGDFEQVNGCVANRHMKMVNTLLARIDELESDCAALKVGIEAISSLCDRKDAERERLKAQRDALAELVEAADLAADVYPDTDDPDFDDAMSDMCQALAKLKEVE